MSGLTEQDKADLTPWFVCDMSKDYWPNGDDADLIATVAQIRARAVAETAERIAVAILALRLDTVTEAQDEFVEAAARIARAEAGR